MIEKGEKKYLILNEKKFGPYEEVSSLTFSDDDQRFAFTFKREGKWYIDLDGKEFGPYDMIMGGSIFSPDSQRFAFAFKRENKWYIDLDGKELSQKYDLIESLFSFDSESKYLHLGTLIGNELWWIVKEAKQN